MKSIIITGASSGIGRATAELFLSKGWRVGLIARRAKVLAEIAAFDASLPEGVEVHHQDERLTSVTAERRLTEMGVKGKRRKQLVDQIAAAVILQTWIDGQHMTE